MIINKGGLSEAGGRAVASHTGLHGREQGDLGIAHCGRPGPSRWDDLWELAQTRLAFSLLPVVKSYRGISVAGGGGALGVSAGDRCRAVRTGAAGIR
ncbi:MAG: hypothetical protein M0C28_31725 [Candidatus Moduliflexus flocculans]|nr:hypothetical protein [Candidatus Moduliflexus flocculans]